VGIVIVVVLVIMLYRRVRPIIDSVKSVTRTVENISSCVEEEVVGPLAQVVGVVQGFRRAVGMVNRGKK
jgi:hypothetical protein